MESLSCRDQATDQAEARIAPHRHSAVGMAGMFTVLKMRASLAANDYRGPAWYQHPPGTLAYEWTGAALPEPTRDPKTPKGKRARETDLRVVDPRTRRTAANTGGHGNH